MILEDLLDCDPEVIKALTKDELEKLCMPHWTVTRPSYVKAEKEKKKSKAPMSKEELNKRTNLIIAVAEAKKIGIDLSHLLK